VTLPPIYPAGSLGVECRTPHVYSVALEYWAQRTVSPLDGREGWTVVDKRYAEHHRAGEWLRVLVDAEGSVGTAHTYAGRIALYLTWAAGAAVDELKPTVEQLAAFARWLERTPSRKHRPGPDRRLASEPGVLTMAPARSAATIDGVLAATVEFVRFAASRGWVHQAAAEALSSRERLRFAPARMPRGERVEALYATGLRVAELCGLHLSDMHLVPSALHLGCKVPGAHLHVLRREDNENGALAKSFYPRVVPVAKELVWLHDAYRAVRDDVAEAAGSDYVLVNLWRAPLGRALSPDSVEQLFVRLSAKAGFRARPHMLRHSFASEVALLTKDPALVKELLGHASVASTDVYLHARWADMRAAVDGHAPSQAGGPQ
jgi:integrase/recombinase XerD